MIDALLFSVRDAIRNAGYGYDYKTCEIMADEMPKPSCGDWFISVHQAASTSDMMNALNEYYGFILTLTARVKGIPLDRIGDSLLAVKLANKLGFNRRAGQLKSFLHMDWGILQDANDYMVAMEPDAMSVNGFCEPAAFKGMDIPVLVGPEWFDAKPGSDQVGLKADLRFDGARRLQPIATYI
jgi:hypothetical protein